MRRFIPTLLAAFILLAVSAAAIVVSQSGGLDLNAPRGGLLLVAGGVLGALVAVAVLGGLFGLIVNQVAKALSDERPAAATPAASRTAPAVKKEALPPIPLSDDRSLTVFYAVIGLGVLGFLMFRWISAGTPPGYPLDRLPDLSAPLWVVPGLNFAVTTGLAVTAVALTALVITVVVGVGLAKLIALLGRRTLSAEASAKAESAPAQAGARPRAAGPAAKAAAGEAASVFLYDNRSLLVFSLVVGLSVFAFLLFRSVMAGVPLGYFPSFGEMVNLPLFKLPGEPIAGLPEFIPGPGRDVTALQVFIAVVVGLIGGVAVLGFGLARGLVQFTAVEKTLTQTPVAPAWPAPQLATLEPRLKAALSRPFPPRLNGLDQLIVLIFVVLLGLFAAWVLPGIGLVGVTDRSVAATQIAALWTPTPLPGPTATPGPPLDVLVAGLPKGDPAAGKAHTEQLGCVACHIGADPSVALVGPAWLAARSKDGKGIADHAAARWQEAGYTGKAKSATEYLYEAIVEPNAFVVSGFQPGLMPQVYGQQLTPQELADILAYLETLK